MIHLLDRPATPRQVRDMLEVYPILVKIGEAGFRPDRAGIGRSVDVTSYCAYNSNCHAR